MKRSLLLSAFAAQPWAMDPAHLSIFAGVLRRWSAGAAATPETMDAVHEAQASRAARARQNANVGGGIAVLSLSGVLCQRASMADDISGSGGTSTEAFTQALRAAVADPAVGGIIIQIDSPGGSVFGCGELASELLAARASKPIYGFVSSLCASAAYWIGAQCTQLLVTPGGQAGSVGVYMTHTDASAAMEMKGSKTEFISAGKYKVEGNPLAPLDGDARAFLQSQVDAYYAMFTSAVAKGRGVPVASVRAGFGEGRCLMAADALTAGMIDGICTFDDVVAKMTKAIKAGPSATILLPEVAAVVDPLDVEFEARLAASDVLVVVDPAIAAIHAARFAARQRDLDIAAA